MKSPSPFMIVAACVALGVVACSREALVSQAIKDDLTTVATRMDNDSAEGSMKITIGSETFEARLEDNPAVAKLKSMLPLTLDMTELNGNEKYYHLATRLPTDEIDPGTIQDGDIMLYGNNSLVLFYKSFKTSYSYTRLGRVDNPSGLAEAVGEGEVTVTFESKSGNEGSQE